MSAVLAQSSGSHHAIEPPPNFPLWSIKQLFLLTKCPKRLLAQTLPGPLGPRVEASNCVPLIVHPKGLYGLSSLHNCVRSDEMNSKAFSDTTHLLARSRLIRSESLRETGNVPGFVTRLLILVQGWGRAVRKTFSCKKILCVCVCVCVCAGWGLYKLPPHPAGSSASFPSFRNNQQTTLLSTKTCLMSPYLLCSCRSHTNGEREGKRERKKRERERALRLLLHIWLTDKQSLGYALVSRRGGGQLCVDGTALVTPKPWRLSPDIKQKKRSEGCTQAHARAHAVEASRIVSLWLSRTTTIGLFRNRGLVHSRWGQPSPQRWKTSCSW